MGVKIRIITIITIRASNLRLFSRYKIMAYAFHKTKLTVFSKSFISLIPVNTRKHGGTGLGLVICKGIVEVHGGKIWVDKSYREGASIMFSLQIKKETTNKNACGKKLLAIHTII